MASTNRIHGLFRGPFDHKASSVINLIANGSIDMGSAVTLENLLASDIVPRVVASVGTGNARIYGVAVGGDVDGIYGDGSAATSDENKATNAAGQGVVVVTQGRCPARCGIQGGAPILPGDKLTAAVAPNVGILKRVQAASETVIAIALGNVNPNDTDMILVDVQRQGEAVNV